MLSAKSKPLYNDLHTFIERIENLFPNIKSIEHNNEIFKDSYAGKAYMKSSDSSGVHVYFYNITYEDILLIINEDFEKCSINIKEYISVLKLYNYLLYNIISEKYNIGINLIDYMDERDDSIYKIKAINQKPSTILLSFHDYEVFENEDNLEEVDGKALIYKLSFKNEAFYNYLVKALNKQVNKYVDISTIRSDNIKEYSNLIQMLKI